MGSGIGKKLAKLNEKLGGQAGEPGIMERLERLEKQTVQIVGAINQSLQLVENRLSTLEEVLDATVGVIGAEQVQALIEQRRKDKAQAQADAEKAAVEAAVEAGTAVPADTIAESTLIVGTETNAEGEEVFPGRAQLLFSQVREDMKATFLGKKCGESIDLPAGGKFTVTAVYTLVPKAVPAEAEAAPADPVAAIEQDLASTTSDAAAN